MERLRRGQRRHEGQQLNIRCIQGPTAIPRHHHRDLLGVSASRGECAASTWALAVALVQHNVVHIAALGIVHRTIAGKNQRYPYLRPFQQVAQRRHICQVQALVGPALGAPGDGVAVKVCPVRRSAIEDCVVLQLGIEPELEL